MKKRDYEKALIRARIESHRKVLGLELKLARANFHPLSSLASLLGVDRHLIDALIPLLHLANAELRPRATDESGTPLEATDEKSD